MNSEAQSDVGNRELSENQFKKKNYFHLLYQMKGLFGVVRGNNGRKQLTGKMPWELILSKFKFTRLKFFK